MTPVQNNNNRHRNSNRTDPHGAARALAGASRLLAIPVSPPPHHSRHPSPRPQKLSHGQGAVRPRAPRRAGAVTAHGGGTAPTPREPPPCARRAPTATARQRRRCPARTPPSAAPRRCKGRSAPASTPRRDGASTTPRCAWPWMTGREDGRLCGRPVQSANTAFDSETRLCRTQKSRQEWADTVAPFNLNHPLIIDDQILILLKSSSNSCTSALGLTIFRIHLLHRSR